MKHVLVVGGTGMLSGVSLWLLESGYHVSIVARDPKHMGTLTDERFQVWLSECYQHKPHSALDNKCPEAVFRGDAKALRFVDADSLSQAFLHSESRKVDKSGCISFMNLICQIKRDKLSLFTCSMKHLSGVR